MPGADTDPVNRASTRWALLAVVLSAAAVAMLGSAGTGEAGSSQFECRFQGPRYPALTRTSRPGSTYVVFIRRQLTCDEARSVARRGTGTLNPGRFRSFTLRGGWICMSFAPAGNGKVLAGQCAKPGSRALVNWLPICESGKPCKNLRGEG
ncbi:MAG: hypothetical protein ACRDPX_02185 [Gaiellaceae bacterium]